MHTQYVLQTLAEGFSTAATGQALFRSLAESLAKALAVDYVFVGECSPADAAPAYASVPPADRLEAFYVRGREAEEIHCGLAGSLLQVLAGNRLRTIPAGVQRLFPNHQLLKTLGAEGYAGVPLLDAAGAVTGVLCVMHPGPLPKVAMMEAVLGMVAKRTEGELVRFRQERQLREAQEEVRRTKALLARQEAACREAGHQRQQVEGEVRVHRLLDSMAQIAWTADPEGNNTYISEMWNEYTGVSMDGGYQAAFHQVMHPEDITRALQETLYALSTGNPFQVHFRIRRRDGQYRWMLSRALPVRNEAGEISEWMGTMTDIHEQKAALDFLYTVLEGMPLMAWTAPPGATINYFNKRWYDYTGLTEAESLEMGWQRAVHPDDLPLAIERRTAGHRNGQPYEVENRYRRADGTCRWHLARVAPIRDEAGDITLWVGTATDIHDHKTAQHHLENTLRELHEKNFELDQFVYKTSHDLRSPLSTILGLVDILRQEPDQATRRQYVDLIANRVHKLDRFIRSMLDYSRNTRTATSSEAIDVAVLVQECFADLEYMKHFGRLRLTLRVGEGRFCSDVFRLRIIFSNLISNAIKYQDFNKPRSRLNITVEITPAQVVIRCADNGVGIDPAYQAKVFDMFFRAAEQSDGSGLGLYIVKQAVAVLHGTIGMQSQVGTGTQFTITLPNGALGTAG
jgi:PAS domain S-box-containing protein